MKKKLTAFLLITVTICGAMTVFADSSAKNFEPGRGEGWLTCVINDTVQEFEYINSVKSMTNILHTFESKHYTLSFSLDKKNKIGEMMSLNAINSIEIVSSEEATVGYYATKKSRSVDVESEVVLDEPARPEIIQGRFSVIVPKGDRWVGDLRPGILDMLEIEDGEFCFFPDL